MKPEWVKEVFEVLCLQELKPPGANGLCHVVGRILYIREPPSGNKFRGYQDTKIWKPLFKIRVYLKDAR